MTAPGRSVVVIGAGPAGLMAAEILADKGVAVTVCERMPSVGRKFLMAGRGGLNLTHSEPLPAFLARYQGADPRLRAAIEGFPPERLRAWCEALGQPTFVGSSGRIFPKAMKTSPLLRAWMRRLAGQGVRFAFRHRWTGWDGGALRFETPDGPASIGFDATVLALGGASWGHLGSDGGWVEAVVRAGATVAPLRPANCGFLVDWSPRFRDRHEGVPLKNVALEFGGRRVRGDVLVTRAGLEGGAVYGLSAPLRDAIAATGRASVRIDLRPDASAASLATRLAARGPGQSLATVLRKAVHLAPVAIALLHEAAIGEGRPLANRTAAEIAALMRAVPIGLSGVAPLARAISTAGGLRFEDLDDHFMLRRVPGVFVAGEMLDWEAPTGGYLLQACFATGVAAGTGAAAWLATQPS